MRARVVWKRGDGGFEDSDGRRDVAGRGAVGSRAVQLRLRGGELRRRIRSELVDDARRFRTSARTDRGHDAGTERRVCAPPKRRVQRRITASREIPDSEPTGITRGPGLSVWFLGFQSNRVYRYLR